MERHNILILAKTYPSISTKYRETVCTAGILLSESLEPLRWIRIYPIRFRSLDEDSKFKKWAIISAEIERNHNDHRKESYRIKDSSIEEIRQIGTEDKWNERRDLLFPFKVSSTSSIRDSGNSIGLIKPTMVKRCYWKNDDREWAPKQQAVLDQEDLLAIGDKLSDLEKIPYKFYYEFLEEDGTCHNYSIIDWEILQLYRNCRNRSKLLTLKEKEEEAVEKVNQKLEEKACKCDLNFILGSLKNHSKTFLIIGLFYPPIIESEQLKLDI